MNLCEAILKASKERGIDPFKTPFKPSDLGLKASDYGSFSDWCEVGETKSARYNPRACLRVKEWRGPKPYRYLLRSREEWR